MGESAPHQKVTQLFEDLLVAESFNRLEGILTEDCHIHDPSVGGPLTGRRLLCRVVDFYKGIAPDLSFSVDDISVSGDTLSARWRASGQRLTLAEGVRSREAVALSGSLTAHFRDGLIDNLALASSPPLERSLVPELSDPGCPATDEIAVRVSGEASGTPLFFVPTSLLPGWKTWARFTKHFERVRPVVNMKLIATRCSFEDLLAPEDYSASMEVSSMRRALARRQMTNEAMDLIGWSLGGSLAIDYATSYPESVRSLAIVEPTATWCLANRAVEPEIAAAIQRRLRSFSRDEEITEEHLEEFLFEIGTLKGTANPRAYEFWPLLSAYRQVLKYRGDFWLHSCNLEKLRALEIPVYLFKGSRSLPLYHKIIDVLAAEIPKARVIELPGGHRSHGENPQRFVDLLAELHGAPPQPWDNG